MVCRRRRCWPQPALAAVREGKTKFIPENWEKTYFQWLENIQPWCISRQLWWGHQIPGIWYGPRGVNGYLCVEETRRSARRAASILEAGPQNRSPEAQPDQLNTRIEELRQPILIWRDEDVLDTWFSSALWPFSTLGWPDETPELKRYYPTNALVTGFDIIFFWVARMMMMGLHFMDEVPFHDVYIHALVRDEKGAKMSKSKGNVIDPLGLIDEYGADSLRFTLAAMAAQGRDIKLSTQRVEGYRNFATKLWNAARFAEINGCAQRRRLRSAKSVKVTLNDWIIGEAAKADRRGHRRDRSLSLQRCRQCRLSLRLEHFLRLVSRTRQAPAARRGRRGQGRDAGDDRLRARRDRQAAASLHALHHRGALGDQGRAWAAARKSLLALAPWPQLEGLENAAAEAEIGLVVEADLGNPLGALRDECAGGRADPARAWSARTKPSSARVEKLGRDDQASRAALRHFLRGRGAGKLRRS